MDADSEPGRYDERTLPPQISGALQYIEAHSREPIEVEQLARSAGWSHKHFTRTFQQYVGHAPKHGIIKRKMNITFTGFFAEQWE